MSAASVTTLPPQVGRRLRSRLAKLAGAAAVGGVAVLAFVRIRRLLRSRRARLQLDEWCRGGPAQEPIVECEVPVSHGAPHPDYDDKDVVEVPIGLVFECDRLRQTLSEKLGCLDDEALVEALQAIWAQPNEENDGSPAAPPAAEAETEVTTGAAAIPSLSLPWIDLAALAQLTYWYDRRQPPGEVIAEEDRVKGLSNASSGKEQERLTDAKFGRWTKKVSREQVIYGAVALRYRTRGHLGAQVFRRPTGIDVTRLRTLHRAASLCRHEHLLGLVEGTMEQLKPKNVARIPWSEVRQHTSKNDLWLMIDRKVYDVTSFLDLHPGGGQLIVEAAGKDATALFERTHGEGLRYSLRLLNQFFIGVCEGADEAEPAEPGTATPEFLETLRSITGALHEFDEARATGEAQGLA